MKKAEVIRGPEDYLSKVNPQQFFPEFDHPLLKGSHAEDSIGKRISESAPKEKGSNVATTEEGATLYGTWGDDHLIGTSGNDTLYDYTAISTNILEGAAGDDTYNIVGGQFGFDVIIDDISGKDTLNINWFSEDQAQFSPIDTDENNLYDALHIEIASGMLDITIKNYYDDTSSIPDALSQGSGFIESINFVDPSVAA